MYIILTPHEYYIVLPALAINGASKPRLATSALHTAFLSNSITSTKKHFKMNKEIGMILPKKRVNTSGVGESNNYYEDIYNIYTSLQQHSLTIPIDSTH